jgi:hypothetical protein
VTVPALEKVYAHRMRHDPRDIDAARRLAEIDGRIRLGVFFRDESRPRYEEIRRLPHMTVSERARLLEKELELYAV